MTTQITKVQEIRQSMTNMGDQFQAVLPPHISVAKFTRVAMTAIQNNPDLAESDKTALYSACMKCAESGLLPDGKQSALVIYNKKQKNGSWLKQAQFMPMVAGILKMVRNSGELSSLNAFVVYEKDEFNFHIDENGEHFKHVPLLNGDRGKFSHVYAVAKTKDGGSYFEIMSQTEIEKIKASSKTSKFGPWQDWYEEMAKKSVIRRLSKRLPMSTDVEKAVESVDEMYNVKPEAPVIEKTESENLTRIIKSSTVTPTDEEII